MSDTPRTDSNCWTETGHKNGEVVLAEFARQLERELAAKAEACERLRGDKAMQDVIAECRRQVEVEGWTPEHDDEHAGGQLAAAAAEYAAVAAAQAGVDSGPFSPGSLWPWDGAWFKPKDQRRNLVRAAALLIAELRRVDRAALLEAK